MSVRRVHAAIVLALAGVGCGDRPPSGPTPVYPVSGRVTFKGRPVPGSLVVFHRDPADRGPDVGKDSSPPTPTGKTDSEGRFKMHTYFGDDGAPAGAYKVTVASARSAEMPNILAKESSIALKVSLPAKYADPARSGLVATVKEGDDAPLAFDLK